MAMAVAHSRTAVERRRTACRMVVAVVHMWVGGFHSLKWSQEYPSHQQSEPHIATAGLLMKPSQDDLHSCTARGTARCQSIHLST